MLDLVQLDLAASGGTVLEDTPVIPVSARTGEGLEPIKAALTRNWRSNRPRSIRGVRSLWIDSRVQRQRLRHRRDAYAARRLLAADRRSNSCRADGVAGFVDYKPTRSRLNGAARQPGRREPGRIDKHDVQRGDLLTLPGTISPTTLAAVRFRHLPMRPGHCRHNAEVKFFCGTAETVARVRLLDVDADTGDRLQPASKRGCNSNCAIPCRLSREIGLFCVSVAGRNHWRRRRDRSGSGTALAAAPTRRSGGHGGGSPARSAVQRNPTDLVTQALIERAYR